MLRRGARAERAARPARAMYELCHQDESGCTQACVSVAELQVKVNMWHAACWMGGCVAGWQTPACVVGDGDAAWMWRVEECRRCSLERLVGTLVYWQAPAVRAGRWDEGI